jgi:hypothetical protein
MSLLSLLACAIPRWQTDDWAAQMYDDGTCEPVKTMDYVTPGETFDGILTLSSFTWFGLCYGGGGETLLKDWANPHDKVTQ